MVMSTMITITVTIMKAMITTVLVITITMTIIKEKKSSFRRQVRTLLAKVPEMIKRSLTHKFL